MIRLFGVFQILFLSITTTTIVAQRQRKLDELNSSELSNELSKMTLEELEDICTRRGFELITDEFDEETGHPLVYTKDDYITAAWQCVTM